MINKEYSIPLTKFVEDLFKNIEAADRTFGPSISTGQYNDSCRNINFKLKDEDSGEQDDK